MNNNTEYVSYSIDTTLYISWWNFKEVLINFRRTWRCLYFNPLFASEPLLDSFALETNETGGSPSLLFLSQMKHAPPYNRSSFNHTESTNSFLKRFSLQISLFQPIKETFTNLQFKHSKLDLDCVHLMFNLTENSFHSLRNGLYFAKPTVHIKLSQQLLSKNLESRF